MEKNVNVRANPWYVHINRGALKGNYWISDMYIRVWQAQREYLVGKPQFAAKTFEQPGGQRC